MTENYPYVDEVRADIARMIPPDGKVIGTIGCGTAATEAPLVAAGRQVHGVDVHAPSIERAKQRLTTARVVSPDDNQFFEPASLDGLILADVIEHMPNAWDRLAAFAKFVKPGGWVVISVPNMRNFPMVWHFLFKGDWPERATGVFDGTHLQVMSHRRLARWCQSAGLRPEVWFDQYAWIRGSEKTSRRLDAVTLRLMHTWFMYQVQVRCRREG